MINQLFTIERQPALLAACPRPRILATPVSVGTSAVSASPVSVLSVITLPVPSAPTVAWSSAAASVRVPSLGAVAVEPRRSPSAEALHALGFAEVERPATVDRPMAGYARRGMATGINGGNGITGTESTTVKQQDKQHLTARRGPVTWRPPH